MPNDIVTFVAWIIDQRPEAGKIPEAEKAIMRKDLESQLDQMVNTALLAEMSPEQLDEFSDLLDEDSEENVQYFIEQAVPHSKEIVTGVLADFAKMYLGESHARTSDTPSSES
ncbi:MAG TPA: DUF5663 domain-containing protein [Candidatus Saccharimonadia bacterium]